MHLKGTRRTKSMILQSSPRKNNQYFLIAAAGPHPKHELGFFPPTIPSNSFKQVLQISSIEDSIKALNYERESEKEGGGVSGGAERRWWPEISDEEELTAVVGDEEQNEDRRGWGSWWMAAPTGGRSGDVGTKRGGSVGGYRFEFWLYNFDFHDSVRFKFGSKPILKPLLECPFSFYPKPNRIYFSA